jgi:ATP-dependent DNA helicase RecG
MLHLSDSLSKVPGIGAVYAKKLLYLGLETVEDLVFYFPFRYDDFKQVSGSLYGQMDSKVVLIGRLLSIENIFTRTGKKMTKALFEGEFGLVSVIWFNQPYLAKSLKVGSTLKLSGKLQEFARMPSLMSPQWERVESEFRLAPTVSSEVEAGAASLVPIYSETFGVTSKWIKDKVSYVLAHIERLPDEYLPQSVISKHNLPLLSSAVAAMHSPKTIEEVSRAKNRFAYEELFMSQIRSSLHRKEWKNQKVDFVLNIDAFKSDVGTVAKALPFSLTGAQQRCVAEILHDLANSSPMNRLLEGDVGSGKTVVAALAMYAVYKNGYKSLLMAPTQILATQHFETISRITEPFGLKVALITGGKKTAVVTDADIYVGTHALLHLKTDLKKVALTIIDEQHRFGVAQRATLRSKYGTTHMLSMTATPIPRTLALTLYGDLDLSLIDEMPPGRKPVKTWVVPAEKRESSYDWIKKFITETKEQVFIVCPFIEPSESDTTVKAAVEEFEKLKKEVFKGYKLGILHGGMKAEDKDAVLLSFRNKEFDILICTPVVEVGIDIPSASIVIIESADRFGLAQLHQFRGRVGRAGQQAYCLLFATSTKQEDSRRLKSLETIYSGMKLAEVDLEIRGVGNIFGVEQHGKAIFKYADFFDLDLVHKAKEDARAFVEDETVLENYPTLLNKIKRPISSIAAN